MSDSENSFSSTLLPILRKAVPTMLASSIVNVQPMAGNTGQMFIMKNRVSFKPFKIVESTTPGWVKLTVSSEVYNWLKEFPQDQWRVYWPNTVCVTEELFTLLALKWSGE